MISSQINEVHCCCGLCSVVVMYFLFAIAITLQTTSIFSKKYDSSSDESIENILFYKDYRPKKKEPPPMPAQPLVLPKPPPQPECIPRMCCSMSCSNSCGQNENPGQMESMQPMQPMNSMNSMNPMNPMNPVKPMQPQRMIPPFAQHKKKKLPPLPFPSRKSFGFTREHIKSLISKDEDIKNILKDLVRVTMKKVDLLEMIKARRADEMNGNPGINNNEEDIREL